MYPSEKPSVLYENRYCNQNEFDIVVLGKRNKSTNETVTISCPDFIATVERSLIPPPRNFRKTVFIGSDIYTLDEDFNKKVYKNIFKVYSKKT